MYCYWPDLAYKVKEWERLSVTDEFIHVMGQVAQICTVMTNEIAR